MSTVDLSWDIRRNLGDYLVQKKSSETHRGFGDRRGRDDGEGEAERKSEGRHSQLVEAVQPREGPVGVLYCA